MDVKDYMQQLGRQAREASRATARASTAAKNTALLAMAGAIRARASELLAANAADVADKFQTLVREVMNTQIGDLRKIGEEVRLNETTQEFTVYTAYEIKKNAMFRFMKKQAQTNEKLDETARKRIEEILDEEIKKADLEDHD